jgi:phosphoglycolate phosphatase-like HAD superfamily hydrolase
MSTVENGAGDMSGLSGVEVIAFDLDNCLLLDEEAGRGSADFKDGIWQAVFAEYDSGEVSRARNAFKLDTTKGQADRRDIAKHLLMTFGFVTDDMSAEIGRRCEMFNDVVQTRIRSIPISSDKRRALQILSGRLPLYVNTATPGEAAIESLIALDLYRYFAEIYGRPGTKLGNLQSICSVENIPPDRMLFVDDDPKCAALAEEFGCKFVGMYTQRNAKWCDEDHPFPIIRSFAELPGLLGFE